MNASWTGEEIRSNPEINISVAMAVKDGVVGAVIHKATRAMMGEYLRSVGIDGARASRPATSGRHYRRDFYAEQTWACTR